MGGGRLVELSMRPIATNVTRVYLYWLAMHIIPGAYPLNILQHKFYATIIFKHPDWLINLSSQSECLKN